MPKVRPIDANALFNDLKESAKSAREWREETQDEEIKIRAEQAHGTFVECALRVKNAPTIEPEVRHGRWINDELHGKYNCTCCNKGTWRGFGVFDFCPNCGARMDADDIAERRAAMDDYAEY